MFRQYDPGNLLGDGADMLRKNCKRLPSSLMRMVVVLMMVTDLGRTLDPGRRLTGRVEPVRCDVVRRELLPVDQAVRAVRGSTMRRRIRAPAGSASGRSRSIWSTSNSVGSRTWT